VLGVAVLLLVYIKFSGDETTPAPAPSTTAVDTEPSGQLPEFAPPPPPEEEEEEDAGVDAGIDAGKKVAAGKANSGASGGGACSSCGKGEASSGLAGAVSSTAGLARGCYNRALRAGGAEGRINVSISVGADGSVCNAAITSDSVNNPAISSCVIGKFRSRTYPKPKRGCVVVNVPINFKMKTQ